MQSITTPIRLYLSMPVLVSVIIAFTLLVPYPGIALSDDVPKVVQEVLIKNPVPVRPFELVDQEKKAFNIDRLKGAWTLMFFGYTHCPDVCPTTLTELDNAASRLNKFTSGKNKLQYVFVSIDPDRDTPELLGDYVSYFGAKFIAVTGKHEQLKQLANPLGIHYKIGVGFNKEYIVEHSSAMLLIDPEGRYYARFPAPHYAEVIVAGFKALRKYYEENNK